MLRNRATPVRFLSGIHAHTTPAETHMPKYIGPVNIDAQYQAFGDKRGIIVMGLPNTGVFGVWSGTEWLAYDVFDWAFLERQPHFRSGHVDIQLMQVPHLTFVEGPLKGTLLDAYDTTEQMLTAAFRAGSISKLTQTDAEVRQVAEQLQTA